MTFVCPIFMHVSNNTKSCSSIVLHTNDRNERFKKTFNHTYVRLRDRKNHTNISRRNGLNA